MLHARLFAESQKYRDTHFQATRTPKAEAQQPGEEPQPWLDGNPSIDRPLFVQFCANEPATLLAAAKLVAPYCDAVDLNLGCPQGIARKGHYGAFLQEDQDLIYRLIRTLHEGLSIPVTAKIRILETREATLAYARNVLAAGASILTVHGRRREQKGHLTGLADWEMIRYLRDNLPAETVLFANGNILQHGDVARALAATGADGIMSAEGHLSDPAIFSAPPDPGAQAAEYWRGRDGRGGWRVDAVVRRYLDILHTHALDAAPPARAPLFVPGDDAAWLAAARAEEEAAAGGEPPSKKQRTEPQQNGLAKTQSPNLAATQAHLFHLLRHFVSHHTDVRDALARARGGDLASLERILAMVELRVAEGIIEYERMDGAGYEPAEDDLDAIVDDPESSTRAVRRCKRPWWVVQPIIRPMPKEALAKGAIQAKKQKNKPAKGAADSEDVQTASASAAEPGAPSKQPADATDTAVKTEELEKKATFQESNLVSG
jgi:tRNA-dihydrouridine synthase 1